MLLSNTRSKLAAIATILSIMGLITFALFILEEAMQTIMFGTWAAQDAGDWALVLAGCETNRKINRTLKIVNYSVGWIQPFAFIAYRSYGEAMDFYIEALERKILRREPGLFIGKELTLTVQPVNHKKLAGEYLIRTKSNLLVLSTEQLRRGQEVSGIITKYKNTVALTIETSKKDN